MHLSKIQQLMFATDLEGAPAGDLSIEGMIDELGKEDATKEEDTEDLLKEEKNDEPKEKKVKSETTDDDEEVLELGDEEDEEPEIDELQPVEEISRKDILKKYPDLFKDFPQLEAARYREKEYAKVFPTIDDAKEAGEKVANYDRFESQVLNGDLGEVLAGVKNADAKAYNKMVDNYLPMLGKVDQQAYFHIIGNITKRTIAGMYEEANKSENEDLKAAAVILHQYMFGNSEYKKPENYGPHKADESETELSKEKQQFAAQKFETALESVATTNMNAIKSTISHHMDPKGVMTDYVKRTAVKEAIAEVEETMNSNTRFKALMDKLWKIAIERNHDRQSLDNIKRAHLNQAKTLLRPIILKHKNAALKGMGKRVSDEREEPQKKGPVSIGRAATAKNSGNKETTVPKGMRTLDYLNSDD